MIIAKNAALFVNASGENDCVASFLDAVSPTAIENSMLVAIDEQLPVYKMLTNKHRKQRYEEIIKNANTNELSALNDQLQSLNWLTSDAQRLTGHFPAALIDWMNQQAEVDLVVKQSVPCDGDYGNASKGDIKMIRQSSAPVLLLHAHVNKAAPVIAAIPPIGQDQSGLKLANRVLTNAINWAAALGAPIKIVRAWQLVGEHLLEMNVPAKEVEEALKEEQEWAEHEMKTLIDNADIPDDIQYEVSIEKGNATRVIHEKIDGLSPSVVVLGAVARDGLSATILGSTAESVIRKKSTSVLVVK